MKKSLLTLGFILVAQAVVAGSVVAIFMNISSSRKAAALAATLFLVLGILMVVLTWKLPQRKFLLTFWNGWVHLLVFTLPMLLMRLVHWNLPFAEIQWWGLKATTLHNYSLPFYKWMMVAVVIDLLRLIFVSWRLNKTKQVGG
ncbi:MAG: hypothetical protein KDD61_05465 [Bdellovibrionales bacterium]|nr:hypothetical protein [Bdellovibrionales bacterium]